MWGSECPCVRSWSACPEAPLHWDQSTLSPSSTQPDPQEWLEDQSAQRHGSCGPHPLEATNEESKVSRMRPAGREVPDVDV